MSVSNIDNLVEEAVKNGEAAIAALTEAKKVKNEATSEVEEAVGEKGVKDNPTVSIYEQAAKEIDGWAKEAERCAKEAKEIARKAQVLADQAVTANSPEAEEIVKKAERAARHSEAAKLAMNEANSLKVVADKLASAALVAEKILNLEIFFETHKKLIYEKLEYWDDEAGKDNDLLFIAEGLPIIHGIIQVGSEKDAFEKAKSWVKGKWKTDNPLVILSALVFIYVAERGVKDPDNSDPEKRKVWRRIKSRVRRQLAMG